MKAPVLTWEPLSDPALTSDQALSIQNRVASICASWEWTRYLAGQSTKGAGVDCVRFVAAVLDELFRSSPRPLPVVSQDASYHDRKTVIAAVKSMMRSYGPATKLRPRQPVQPGDVIAAGSAAGGPGHALVVGGQPSTLWHAVRGASVLRSGCVLIGYRLFRVYRLDRCAWLEA